VAAKRDEFPLMGIMKFLLVLRILLPLTLIGVLAWAVQEPSMKLSDKGPFIFIGLGLWCVWEFTRLVKWMGFTVVITDDDITVGKRQTTWSNVRSAKVQLAVKFDTWIKLTLEQGEPLKIPAGVSQKKIVITLVEKHGPELQKPS
jgi:hypothetical protein